MYRFDSSGQTILKIQPLEWKFPEATTYRLLYKASSTNFSKKYFLPILLAKSSLPHPSFCLHYVAGSPIPLSLFLPLLLCSIVSVSSFSHSIVSSSWKKNKKKFIYIYTNHLIYQCQFFKSRFFKSLQRNNSTHFDIISVTIKNAYN